MLSPNPSSLSGVVLRDHFKRNHMLLAGSGYFMFLPCKQWDADALLVMGAREEHLVTHIMAKQDKKEDEDLYFSSALFLLR